MDGVRLCSDNRVADLELATDPDRRCVFNDTSVGDLGRLELLSLVHLGNRHLPLPVRVFKAFACQTAPTLFPNLPV